MTDRPLQGVLVRLKSRLGIELHSLGSATNRPGHPITHRSGRPAFGSFRRRHLVSIFRFGITSGQKGSNAALPRPEVPIGTPRRPHRSGTPFDLPGLGTSARIDKEETAATAMAETSSPLSRRPGVDRVVDEHEPHRPVPRSWVGKSMTGPQEPDQRHGRGGEPDHHPDGEDPRRGSQRRKDESSHRDGKPDVPNSEGPNGHPPGSVVLRLRRVVHGRDSSTVRPPSKRGGHRSHEFTDRDVLTGSHDVTTCSFKVTRSCNSRSAESHHRETDCKARRRRQGSIHHGGSD